MPICDSGLSTVKDSLDVATDCRLQKFYPPQFFLLMNHIGKKKTVNSALYHSNFAVWETPAPTHLLASYPRKMRFIAY